MKYSTFRSLLSAVGGDGGGGVTTPPPGPAPFDPKIHAPEDVRAEPALANIKTIQDLTKGYVHAQKLIGTKRLPAPDANWGEAQWNELYDALGRPKESKEYALPKDVKLPEGLAIDEARLQSARDVFHKSGLTPKQAENVMKLYMEQVSGDYTKYSEGRKTAESQALNDLKVAWGDKFNTNMDLAKAVVRTFGDEEVGKFLEDSGLGNNVPLAKFLAKIGTSLQEDKSRGGGENTMLVTNQTQAIAEIDKMKSDPNFMKLLGDRMQPGHDAAVARWKQLFDTAYPGKQD